MIATQSDVLQQDVARILAEVRSDASTRKRPALAAIAREMLRP
jgi:cell pole-organizing protein PopZ